MSARGWLSIFFILLFPALLCGGCGKKTMPVAPQTVLPASIQDLACLLDEKGVTLSWSVPKKTEGGEKLAEVGSFEILRAIVPAAEYCSGCPLVFGEPKVIDGEDLAGQEAEGVVHFAEALLRPGHRYFYKVRARASVVAASVDSNVVSFVWDVVPAAPTDLQATVGDKSMVLSWRQSQSLLDGTPVDAPLLYQVFRSEDDRSFGKLGEPVAGTTYVDRDVENRTRYSYRVRAIRRIEDTLLNGVPSVPVTGTPRDMTPPAPPVDFAAVRTEAGIRLTWQESAEPDLAGYRIYRRPTSTAKPDFLAEIPGGASFVDRGPSRDMELTYYITAIDREQPPNESLPSREAVVGAGH